MDLRALLTRAVALQRSGRPAEAEALYRRAMAVAPATPGLHQNLGVLLKVQGREAEAEAVFRKGAELCPDHLMTRWQLFNLLMAQGRFDEGMPLYESRIGLFTPRPQLSFPEWREGPLEGRSLLIWPEQGFGDQIQFARFAPLLAREAPISLLAPPPLWRLFQALDVPLIRAEGATQIPRHEAWALAGSLPVRMGTALATLPAAPYLQATPRGAGGVGVVVRGNPDHENDANRSLDPASAAALLALGRSLLPEDTGAGDFQDTADLVAGLDLVITVDTSVAHLAGALGRPVWILLPAAKTDWRWMAGRADSPWYPSARLFRQPKPGDWASVIADVRQALADL